MDKLAREAIALGLAALDPARPTLSTIQGFTRFKELRSQFLSTRAGAGGRALALAETEEGSMEEIETKVVEEEEIEEVQISEDNDEETPAPEPLSDERVTERLGETNLPKASRKRLSVEYADEESLEEAVKAEIEYVKQITGSGEPFGMDGGPQEQEPLTEEEQRERFNKRIREVGGQEV